MVAIRRSKASFKSGLRRRQSVGNQTMSYQTITFETADDLLTITLNRPDQLNAFTLRMAEEIIEALDRADADDAIRAIIVTGAGRAFCAGADLSAGAASFRPPGDTTQRTELQGSDPVPPPSQELVRDSGGRVA